MGRRKERESKGQRGKKIFPLHPPSFLLPAFLFSHVKDKPGGAAVWPSDCVRRLAVPHTGTPLITGAGLSLLDTKTPHADSTAYTCTWKHANTMNACISILCMWGKRKRESKKERGRERERILRVFTEVHVIISKMFWQSSAEKTEKGMPNSLETHQESSLELV